MLLANKCVAGAAYKGRHGEAQRAFIYRVHDLPDEEKVGELMEFLRSLGIHAKLDPRSSQSFQELIASLQDRPDAAVIQDLTIRSMAKAVYSETNIGHFGLGFRIYTHFTSPIRRYPDLVVHRLLAHEQKLGAEKLPQRYAASLPDIARRSSERERLAVEAERESVKLKEIEYMQQHLGAEFDAVINGVTSYGLYVELIPTLVEGLVHVKNMNDDFYDFDAGSKSLVGRRRKKRYSLGGRITVRVERVDLAQRRLDFVVVQTSPPAPLHEWRGERR
jgi:ribonuclease R